MTKDTLLSTADVKTCLTCGETKPITEFSRQKDGSIREARPCRSCVKKSNDKKNPKDNAVSKEMHRQMTELGIPRRDHYEEEHKNLRHRLRKEIEQKIDADGSWTGAVKPEVKVEVDPLSVRPTKEVEVPLPYFATPTLEPAKARPIEGPTRKALRNNKLYRHAVCEHTGYGPIRDLEFCHTLSFSVCMNHFDKPEWAADINNGFLLLACMNDPMKRGFHWEMEGRIAYYVPPDGEEYPLWMKRLDIPNFWIEPTPEQVNYILLANDYAMGIVY
jgi:hypothetical protein